MGSLRNAVDSVGPLLGDLSDAIVQQVADIVAPLVVHPKEVVRCSAAEALGAAGQPGEQVALALMLRLISDSDDEVRWTALRSLPKVAARGDPAAVDVACRSVSDGDEQIRVAAVVALGLLANKGDGEVMALLKTITRSPAWQCSQCA